jgi:hypothetical protein
MSISLRTLVVLLISVVPVLSREPLRLHPENPHYFLFRDKPTVIVTSGEHYGAVLNLDFNYRRYLETLSHDGLNNTRTFSGAYCEHPSAFSIASNTLAPLPGRYVTPWARSKVPGYANSGNKFDLTQWDKAYFKRLKDFVSEASRRGVIVELNLFCPFYEESMWRLSPMNAINNINEVGNVARTNVYTLNNHGGLLPVQEAMVRKIVIELKKFDNVYYEICNEPYFGGVTLEWQGRIANVILDTEAKLGVHHLISQNIANDKAVVEKPHPGISIFNFHYASPPDTVAMNYGLQKVIGDNETGFRGTNNGPYRMEAWDFMMAGGGLFNHLDYSFVAGFENGTFVYPASQPGGGNPLLRRQFKFLHDTLKSFDFVHMRPGNDRVKVDLPAGVSVRALVQDAGNSLVYVRSGLDRDNKNAKTRFETGEIALKVTLPAGKFQIQWLDTTGCRVVDSQGFTHDVGPYLLKAPGFQDDIALAIRSQR